MSIIASDPSEIKNRLEKTAPDFASTCVSLADVEGRDSYQRWWETGDERELRRAITEGANEIEELARGVDERPVHPCSEVPDDALSLIEAGQVWEAWTDAFDEAVRSIDDGEDYLTRRAAEEITKRRNAITNESRAEALRGARGVHYMGQEIDPKALFSMFAANGLSHEDARKVARVWDGDETVGADSLRHATDRAPLALQVFNDAVDWHGVEEIRQGSDILYDYANRGDSCKTELFYLRAGEESGFVVADLETLSMHDPMLVFTLPPEL